MQLNKDIRNIGVPASTYGENAIIESAQKKLTTENEVTEWIYAMFINSCLKGLMTEETFDS